LAFSIYQLIEMLSKEKGIEAQIIADAVKDAMLVAARKQFKANEEIAVEFDDRGDLQLFSLKKVVESVADPVNELTIDQARKIDKQAEVGGAVRIQKSADALGRISAQTAKQVILQKIREAERDTIFGEYSDRVGELVTCTIKRMEAGDMVVDLGKTEARLPKKEQSRIESFSVGERFRCVIKSVEKSGKNAGVIVSRAAPELVVRLFEQEVPEIYDSTVAIKACAREAGERTKIAVFSRDRDVDSVGACVGMKGMRVQSIIRELRGEKIDIIEFSEDAVTFATHALSPAKISRVAIVDPTGRHMEVIVDDSQLSLAIGKKGQNVRLAAKLLGWRIDIKSEEEKRQEVESAMAALTPAGAPVSVLIDYGLGEEVVERLIESGVALVDKLGAMTPEQIAALPGIDAEGVAAIHQSIHAYYGEFETPPAGGEAPTGDSGEPVEESSEKQTAAASAETDAAPPETAAVSAETEDTESGLPAEDALPDPSKIESATMENPEAATGGRR